MGPVHAGLVMLLRSAPQIIVDLMLERGVLPPGDYIAEVRATEVWIFERGRVSERRVDIALEIRRSDGWRGGGLIEAQLNRDENKPDRWGQLRLAWEHEFGPHLFLVPITLSRSVEDWLRQFVLPFIGDLQGCLIGPSNFPRWSKFDPVAEPERALFMAMITKRGTSTRTRRLRIALGVLDQFRGNTRVIYEQMLLSHFKERMLMNARKYYRMSQGEIDAVLDRYPGYKPTRTEKQSVLYTNGHRDGVLAGREEGQEEGCEALVHAICKVLDLRGVELSQATRTRIVGCRDLPTLARWLDEVLAGTDAESLG